jgi:Holliday junction resolvase
MRARKVDSNHSAVAKRFRELGWSVLDLSRVGSGCPDLLIARNGMNILVEIKDGAKAPSQQKLTAFQQSFHQTWKGPVAIVRSVEEATKIGANPMLIGL